MVGYQQLLIIIKTGRSPDHYTSVCKCGLNGNLQQPWWSILPADIYTISQKYMKHDCVPEESS